MLAAYGCGWFSSLQECAEVFLAFGKSYEPDMEAHEIYKELFLLYREIYPSTKKVSESLSMYR